jgi:hypothetical protein
MPKVLARKSINPDATEILVCRQCGEEFVFLPSSSEGSLAILRAKLFVDSIAGTSNGSGK